MGVHLGNYYGPAILAEYSFKEKTTKIRKCVNEKCTRKKPISDGAHYCPQCGEKIKDVDGPKEEVETPSRDELYNAFEKAGLNFEDLSDETFFESPGDYHIYTPNSDRKLDRNTSPEEPQTCYIDMEEIDIEAEKKWLAEAYAPEINILKSLYKSVTVKWIFVNYLS